MFSDLTVWLKSKLTTRKSHQKHTQGLQTDLGHNYNFNDFYTRNVLILSNHYETTDVDRRSWPHVSFLTHWSK